MWAGNGGVWGLRGGGFATYFDLWFARGCSIGFRIFEFRLPVGGQSLGVLGVSGYGVGFCFGFSLQNMVGCIRHFGFSGGFGVLA